MKCCIVLPVRLEPKTLPSQCKLKYRVIFDNPCKQTLANLPCFWSHRQSQFTVIMNLPQNTEYAFSGEYMMLFTCLFKKLIQLLEGSWNHEYLGSLAKYVKREGLHVNFARDPKLNLLLIFTFYYE